MCIKPEIPIVLTCVTLTHIIIFFESLEHCNKQQSATSNEKKKREDDVLCYPMFQIIVHFSFVLSQTSLIADQVNRKIHQHLQQQTSFFIFSMKYVDIAFN
jgi:hypothetical protein